MAYYTNINLSEANTILELYDLPKAITLTPIGHGISNSNFVVKLADDTEVILKISNDKDIKQLLAEQHILLNLKYLAFDYAPKPILTKKNLPVYDTSKWHGVIFPKFQGKVPTPCPDICSKIGASLATLHLATAEEKIKMLPYPLRLASDVSYFPQDLQDFTLETDCPDDFKIHVNKLLPEAALAFYHSLEKQIPYAILHGDLYYDNTLFFQNDLICMLDFEQAGYGPCIFDIGISISGSCLINKKLDPKLVKAFLHGYQEKRALTHTEKELLYLQVICGFFSIALWRIHRFYLGSLSIERKMSYQELIKIAVETSLTLNQHWFAQTLKAIP